jgi:hypothetical protein
MLREYLRDQQLLYETDWGLMTKTIRPDFWIVSYVSLLQTEKPHGVGYADDVAAVITKRDAQLAQRRLSQVMRLVEDLLNWRKLLTSATNALLNFLSAHNSRNLSACVYAQEMLTFGGVTSPKSVV